MCLVIDYYYYYYYYYYSHVDGSVRLWNSSSGMDICSGDIFSIYLFWLVNFHPLHEFDLSDVFVRGSDAAPDCLAVQQIYLCTLSYMLCVTTSSSNLVCCPFSRNNLTVERKVRRRIRSHIFLVSRGNR